MNLKTKFIVLTAGLAAFAQAQDQQATNTVPADAAVVSAAPAEAATDSAAAPAATEVPAQAEVSQPAENVAAPAVSADSTQAVETASPELPAAQDSIAPVPVPVPEPATDTVATNVEPAATDSAAAAPTDSLAQVAVVDSAAVPAADTVAAAPADSIKPVAEVPAAPQAEPVNVSKDLNVLHGNAYNIVGNEAAASTIGGDLAMPHKMLGHRLGYFEPINGYGVASFGNDKRTYFLAFDNSEDLGLVTAGASFGFIGASLRFAVSKNWDYINYDATNNEDKLEVTSSGTLFGGTVSAKLANFDMALDVEFSNPSNQAYASTVASEIESRNWNLGGKYTIANSSNSKFAWAASLSFERHQKKTYNTQVTYFVGPDSKYYKSTYKSIETDTSSCVTVIPEFNFGSTVLESEKSRLYVGLNTAVPMIAYDRITGVVSRHNEYGVELAPNILGEVVLGKYVMAFGSASYQWNAVELKDAHKGAIGTTSYQTVSGTTTANLGMRLHTDYAALEMVFTNQFVKNPFSSFSNTDEIGFSIGAFVNF